MWCRCQKANGGSGHGPGIRGDDVDGGDSVVGGVDVDGGDDDVAIVTVLGTAVGRSDGSGSCGASGSDARIMVRVAIVPLFLV